MVGHQQKQTRIPTAALVIKSRGIQQGPANPGTAKLVGTAEFAADRDKKPRLGSNPGRRIVMQVFALGKRGLRQRSAGTSDPTCGRFQLIGHCGVSANTKVFQIKLLLPEE